MSKVAFITGGTRGIGREIAITLAENGFDIVVNYREQNDLLASLQEEIESKNVEFLL